MPLRPSSGAPLGASVLPGLLALLVVGLLVLVTACGSESANLPGGDALPGGDGGARDASLPNTPGTAFAPAPSSWAVPDNAFDPQGFRRLVFGRAGQSWTTTDLDGDGRPELVWTMDPTTQKVWGAASAPHWKIFSNTKKGFGANASSWTVPTNAFFAAGFGRPAFDDERNTWALIDLDGDGRSELVWTADPNTQRAWGVGAAAHWKVFDNTGQGFAAEATSWPVPANAFFLRGFHKPSFDDGRQVWSTMDVDGDGRPELVWTADPNTQRVWGAGAAAHWKVFDNTGQGFAAEATSWPVPANAFFARGFHKLASDDGQQVWSTADIDGDGRPELVWTADPNTQRVWGAGAAAHWKVFDNTGQGFAREATSWPVPANAFSVPGFHRLASDDGQQVWSTADIDGDGRPELVWTADPNTQRVWGAGSAPHWKVFKNSGQGFAREATSWSVPDNSFYAPGFGAWARADAARAWSTTDIDGDGRPDLVWTTDPTDATVWGAVGSCHWKVFFNR